MKGSAKIALVAGIFIGLVLGIIFSGIAIGLSGKRIMLTEMRSPYNFDKTVNVIKQRIKQQKGWHVVTVYDENKEVMENGGKTPIGKMKVIKFCNGNYASQMLSSDDRKLIAVMLPKGFAVYEKSDGQVYVSAPNGAVIGSLFTGKSREIIRKVTSEIENIMRFMNFKFTLF